MYKLIIVEDEEIVRRGLFELITNEEQGIEVAGAFEDGKQAYEWLKTNYCDVILTDIVMPQMDGLELARQVSYKNPGIKVVILSGYADFDNAQKALRYNVFDFLQKPVDEDELADLFRRLEVVLEEEQKKDKDINKLKSVVDMLTFGIDSGDIKVVTSVFDDYVDSISIEDTKLIKIKMARICAMISHKYTVRGIDVGKVTDHQYDIMGIYKYDELRMIYWYVMEMFRSLIEGINRTLKNTSEPDYLIGKVKRYIKANVEENIDVEKISVAVGLHRSYLSRVFKEKTGKTVQEYLTEVKMTRACELLRIKEYTVSDVGRTLGYGEQFYFSTVFKKYTGYTPTEYSRKFAK